MTLVSQKISKPLIAVISSVLFICILTTSGYPLSTVPGSKFHFLLTIPIIGIVLVLGLASRFDIVRSNKASTYCFLALLLSSYLSILFNPGMANTMTTAKFWLVITFSYLLTLIIDFRFFVVSFVRVLTLLSALSLIIYGLVNVFEVSLPLPRFTNVKDMSYISGFLFFVYDNHLTYRNMGPFWEPGIYGTYLTFSLIFLTNLELKYKNLSYFILVAALISTMSTASTIFLAFVFCYWISNRDFSLQTRIFVYLFSAIICILFVLNINAILLSLAQTFPSIFSKFTATESASIIERIESPLTNLSLLMESPWYGYGLYGALERYAWVTESAQTSTSTYFLAAFGFLGCIFTFSWVYIAITQAKTDAIPKLILLIFFISFLNKEPHYYFTLTFVFMFYLVNSGKNSLSCLRGQA